MGWGSIPQLAFVLHFYCALSLTISLSPISPSPSHVTPGLAMKLMHGQISHA